MQNRFKFMYSDSALRLIDANTRAVYQISTEGVIQIFDREADPVEVEPVKSDDSEFVFVDDDATTIVDVEKKRFAVHVDGLIKKALYSNSPTVFAISFDTMPEAADFADMVFAERKKSIAEQQMSEIAGKAVLFTLAIAAISFLLGGALWFGRICNIV